MDRFAVPDTYAVWSKNSDTRYNSTSGGAFSEFAKAVIKKGGIVVGARYNDKNLVEHCIIENISDIEKIRQSKYLSSLMGDIFIKVKEKLETGYLVAFCGSPCQVAGLYSFLNKEYDNLFTIDFICRGMNSPKAFKAWLREIENYENSKVTKVWFKYKEGGWKTSPRRTRLDFENGKYIVYDDTKNLYMDGYLSSNLYVRPCCSNCYFKGVPRKSDITLADFWGIEKELDDDKGTSLVMINSDRGRLYFELIKSEIEFFKKEFASIYNGNPMFTKSITISPKSKDFLISLDSMMFSDALRKYTSKLEYIKRIPRKIKKIIKKIIL